MSAPNRSKTNPLVSLLKLLGSIGLGVAIMCVLAVAMGWATFIEREMGTPVAQQLVYASNWFYALIGLLAVNILASALVRVPKITTAGKALTPFFLAHLGVLLLLAGCLATAKFSAKARAIVPEGTGVEKAIDVDSRLFEFAVRDIAAKRTEAPTKIEIPFVGGPMNWRDYEKLENWKTDVSEPLLAQRPEGKFFQNLAKGASKLSHKAAFRAARLARNVKPGVIYDRDGLKLEVLDYITYGEFAPARPLKGELVVAGKAKPFELNFDYDLNAPTTDALASSRRAQRVTLDDGVRVVYMIADSQQDFDAFLNATPVLDETVTDPNAEFGNDHVVLYVDGVRYQKPLADLDLLARYGDLDSQRDALAIQKEEIARRLKLEADRDDVADAEKDAAKPLATTSREDLIAQGEELRKLSEKMTSLADAATDANSDPESLAEFNAARQAFERQRLLNYLHTTWSQLEATTPTSKEFRETLEKMQNQNDLRLADVEKLVAATTLGDSGWKIVGFQTSPTLVPGAEELQGWSAMAQLVSPQGETCEISLFSDIFERNKFPTNGRVYGALWLERAMGDDNEYGRAWSKALDKPKLELMQDLSGRVAYRVNDGANHVKTGVLETTVVDEAAALASAEVKLPGNAIEAVKLSQIPMQDEIGSRLAPSMFQKEQANEFYGKARVRVTLDDVVETFLLRTIPLESVTKEQLPYMERRIVSSKRQATIRLVDKEIDLGATLFVKKFSAVYEPGSATAASFSSLTRILPPGLTLEEQRVKAYEDDSKDVLIQMNRPGVIRPEGSKKTYWAYQDSFRGPFKPGDAEFDAVVQGKILPGETKPRESIYHTIVTLNDDPGRGMKYLGSLLVVWGTAMLVYRRKNRKFDAVAKEIAVEQVPVTADGVKNSGKASTTLVAALAIVATLCAILPQLYADEVVPPDAKKRHKIAVGSKSLDWNTWKLLPVYDGGRRQPLNTFAEILVRDVTGSKTPTIVLPEETLQRLESGKPLNFPSLEEFLNDLADGDTKPSAEKRAEQEQWYKEVAAQAVDRQQDAAKRLRAAFPNGKKRFQAAELLFSWLVEPEIWEYVPFVQDPKDVVAVEVLKRLPEECAKRGSKLSPEDFDAVDPSGKSRVDAFRALARADASRSDQLKALDKFDDKLASYRSVSYVPTQTPSTRPTFYLNKILYGDNGSAMSMMAMMGGAHSMEQSALTKLDVAADTVERLMSREKRAVRKESPFNDKEYVLRRRTPVVGDAQVRETLALAKQIATLVSLGRRYPIQTSGYLYEKLLASLTQTLDDLEAHRDAIMAEEKFSLEYRKEIQRCVAALQSIVDDLEHAYLALTSEPPKTLNVLPVVQNSLFRASDSQDSPWLALQTALFASDTAYARFVDPTLYSPDALPADASAIPTDAEKLSPFDDLAEALRKSIANSKYDRPVSNAFLEAAQAYRDRDAAERATRFNTAIADLAQALEAVAHNAESKRVELAQRAIENEDARNEFLAKTCYDVPKGLRAELFYNRLNAFYWNWVACLAALACFAISYIRQLVYYLTKKERLSEYLFFTLGLAFLGASCVVAFLGGATRAYITGWAPVANMFETVVLLAFLIAAIAIGYATAPAWSVSYLKAWRSTAFPSKRMAQDELRVAKTTLIPRLALVGYCFFVAFRVWRSGHEDLPIVVGLLQTFREAFAMKGALDSLAVLATFLFVVWSVPRFIVALLALACFPKTLCARPDLEGDKKQKRGAIGSEIVQRKAFITASCIIALAVAASAYFNSVEFNPNIRPLVAILRSNFWLTIHVIAIIVSYALGSIAWVVAITSLASYIFGSYGQKPVKRSATETTAAVRAKDAKNAKKQRKDARKDRATQPALETGDVVPATGEAQVETQIAQQEEFEPAYSLKVAPIVATMIRSAVLFLLAGVILGARWADFSWGRFWSWDPKEVWALVTLLIYLVVLHVHKISGGKRFALAIGANIGALAILMTWYGLSFVMGGGRHAYAAGESGKVAVLYILFTVDLLWALLACARYWFEKAKRRAK